MKVFLRFWSNLSVTALLLWQGKMFGSKFVEKNETLVVTNALFICVTVLQIIKGKSLDYAYLSSLAYAALNNDLIKGTTEMEPTSFRPQLIHLRV
jgi:hypothetical protein